MPASEQGQQGHDQVRKTEGARPYAHGADLHDTPRRSSKQLNLLHMTDSYTERDSLKDKLVVYAFILLTVGLLGYAAFEPYLKKKIEVGPTTGLIHDI